MQRFEIILNKAQLRNSYVAIMLPAGVITQSRDSISCFITGNVDPANDRPEQYVRCRKKLKQWAHFNRVTANRKMLQLWSHFSEKTLDLF